MQTAKQLSVTMVNKPGRLAAVLTALNKAKVTLRAMTVMDTGGRGVMRFVPDDPGAAVAALEMLNISCDMADVLLADIHGPTGVFAKSCERLASEHLNIDYAYSSIGSSKKGVGLAVIKVNDLNKAQRVLGEAGSGNHRVVKKRPGRRPVYAR